MPAHFLSSLTLSLAFSTLLTKDHSSVGSRFNPCPSKDFSSRFSKIHSIVLFSHSHSHSLTLHHSYLSSISFAHNFLTNFFFLMPHFFFPSFDLRIPRLFLKKKKRKSLLYPIYLICLAISLETCHVNNNAQLYTIRPSFTAAYLGIFQKKKKYASRFTNPDSTNSRVLACDSTRRHAGNRPPPLVPLLVVRHEGEIAIDRSIDRSMPVDRAEVNFA